MKKKIISIMIVSLMLICSFGIVTAFEIGDHVLEDFPFLNDEYAKRLIQVPMEVRQTQIEMGGIGIMSPPDNNTCIFEIYVVDDDDIIIATFRNDDEYQYVNEGDSFKTVVIHVNISKEFANTTGDAINYSQVYFSLIKSGSGTISEGYLFPWVAVEFDTYYVVEYYGYFYYEFEAGLYLLYTAYDAYM